MNLSSPSTPHPPVSELDQLPGPAEQAVIYLLHRLGRDAHDEQGALTTEMMILTAVLCLIAVAAYALLNGAMNDAAEQIDVNVDAGG